jgi:hypothetical protein
MIIMKHVTHRIIDRTEFNVLHTHLLETTSRIAGVELKNMFFPRGKDEFVLMLECADEDRYLEWRDICPPPPGAEDWYEVWLSGEEQLA